MAEKIEMPQTHKIIPAAPVSTLGDQPYDANATAPESRQDVIVGRRHRRIIKADLPHHYLPRWVPRSLAKLRSFWH